MESEGGILMLNQFAVSSQLTNSEFGAPIETEGRPLQMTNAELEREEKRQRQEAAEAAQNNPMIQGLAAYVRTCWEAARQARDYEMTTRMLKCLRQRTGVHEPEVLQAIQERGGGSDIYMMLTDEKCSAAESWLEDILLPADDKPWSISPTPVPDLPQEQLERIRVQIVQQAQGFYQRYGVAPTPSDMAEVMEEIVSQIKNKEGKHARQEAEDLEESLEDILAEANWRGALKEFLYYFSTFPVAYMKGPVLRTKPTLKWAPDGSPVVEESVVKEYDVPSPFDIYPSPSARTINDGYLIERHILTRSDLYGLIGVEGYNADAIREVLKLDLTTTTSWLWVGDETRDTLEGRNHKDYDPEGRIDALQFWGSVSGEKLLTWSGWDPEEQEVELDPEREYEVEVWLVHNLVIKAVLNPHPLGHKPYFKASYREMKGQFFGVGLPEILHDIQVVCNATARNLVDNMAIASGPQVGLDASVMPEGEDYTNIYPWRVWPFDLQGTANNVGRQRDPIWFFQPKSLASELMSIYEKFSAEADAKSGIPKYSYGQQEGGGPLKTATGFSMMMNNASRGIKKVVRNIDFGVIAPSIKQLYEWMMLYDEEFSRGHTGDIKVIARGSSALVVKEQTQMRLVEVLQLILSSPHLTSLSGLPGIADVFRRVLQGVDVGVDDVVPPDMEIQAMNQAAADQQQQQQAQAAQQGQGPQQMVSGPPVGRDRNYAGEPSGGRDVRLD